jgi:acyl carrier protein
MDDLKEQLRAIFCQVFDDENLEINDNTSSSDIAGWDSIAHLNLIIAIEKKFGIRFSAAELGAIKASSVGQMLALISTKKNSA